MAHNKNLCNYFLIQTDLIMFKNIVCPVSPEKTDSNISRLTVFINAVLMVIYLVTLNPLPLFLFTFDYGVRAFGNNKYSPICFLSSIIANLFAWENKFVAKAPKVFASRLGFICALLGTLFFLFNIPLPSRIIISFFSVLAFMDSVFNLCVGCLIYHHFVFPFYSKREISNL